MNEAREELEYCLFWLKVRKACMKWHGSVTGGPRTDKRNTAVGGVPNSYHLWSRNGRAADLAFDAAEGRERAITWFKDEGFDVIEYSTHIHVEPRE